MNQSTQSVLREQVAAALAQLPEVSVDPEAVVSHVMRPEHMTTAAGYHGPVGRLGPVRPPSPPRTHLVLDVDAFIAALQYVLTNNVAGYAIGLNQNGYALRRAQWGYAHEPQDTTGLWTSDTRSHVASLSKQITAMAMTQALVDIGIRPDAKIIGYLPTYWAKGPNIDQIDFDHLLKHTAGLRFGQANTQSDYETMKQAIASGTFDIDHYSYQNINYGLCRILLTTIYDYVPAAWSPNYGIYELDLIWDYLTIYFYEIYVAQHVFAPAGVSDPTVSAPAGVHGPKLQHQPGDALAYPFPVAGQTGWNSGDLSTGAGADGWHMTVNEVLAVMGTFRRTNAIVTIAQAEAMLDGMWGINYRVQTSLGWFYAKVGYWRNDPLIPFTEQGVLFYLPDDMELVVCPAINWP